MSDGLGDCPVGDLGDIGAIRDEKASAEQVLRRRPSRIGRVRFAQLQVADRCNETCTHCYQVQGHKGELPLAQVLVAIDKLAASGVLALTITGGEPTLRSDLLDIIGHARAHAMAVVLFTNGLTMTQALAESLHRHALWLVQVSLYAVDPQVHDAITHVPGSHGRTLEGIRHLRRASVHVMISFPTMQANAAELSAMQRLAGELGCALKASDEMIPREDGSSVTRGLAMPYDDRVAQASLPEGDWSFAESVTETRRHEATCGVGREALVVHSNGELRPCANLHVPLGNALHDALPSVMTSTTMELLRQVTVQSLHGCRDCDLIGGCTRCHGNAAYEGGDAFGPYESACTRAVARYQASVGEPLEILERAAPLEHPPLRGPFRIERRGVLRPIPDVKTERDDALAREFPWIRPDRGYAARVIGAPRGELVQLRVPPRRRAGS